MAYKSSLRGTRPVSLIAVHTAEGARTARALGAYFYRDDVQASSHVGIDASETLRYVPYDRASWTLRSGNPISENAELCAFAHWTRDQWLSTVSVDGCANPRALLDRLRVWLRERCAARGIPLRRLTLDQIRAGERGVIEHYDWTLAMRDGTHVDPGRQFPWDYVLGNESEEDMTPEEHGWLAGLNTAVGITFAQKQGLLGEVLMRVERKLDAGFGALSDDEDKILEAIRAQAGGGLTPEQYAAILAEQLPSAVVEALVQLAGREPEPGQ